jgi:dynein heavy chain 1, cytosolic
MNTDFKSQLQVKNHTFYLDPPLPTVRAMWNSQLQDWIDTLVTLPHITVFQYEREVTGSKSTNAQTFREIISQLDMKDYKKAYAFVETSYAEVSKYVVEWMHYESLWDVEPTYVYNMLGEDLDNWQKAIVQVKKQRATFDTSMTSKKFDGVEIDFENVQQKVNAQYDQWQRDLLTKYANVIYMKCRAFLDTVGAARHALELGFGATTKETIGFMLRLQECQDNTSTWESAVASFQKGQKTLDRQRFHYPSDWVYIDHIMGEWSAFKDILHRKSKVISSQLGTVRLK